MFVIVGCCEGKLVGSGQRRPVLLKPLIIRCASSSIRYQHPYERHDSLAFLILVLHANAI